MRNGEICFFQCSSIKRTRFGLVLFYLVTQPSPFLIHRFAVPLPPGGRYSRNPSDFQTPIYRTLRYSGKFLFHPEGIPELSIVYTIFPGVGEPRSLSLFTISKKYGTIILGKVGTPLFEDEKKAFDALDEELRKMNRHDQEDDLADILALLDKDYTKPREPDPLPAAPRKPEKKAAATGHENRETRALSQEQLHEENQQTPARKRRGLIPLAILAALELAGIAAVIVWWLQWLG